MITLAVLMLVAATPAMAQDEAAVGTSAFTVTGGATVTTDYRFRGLSQTDKDPAVQVSVNLNHSSGFYAGAWASTIDDTTSLPGYGDAELDLYAGYTKTFDNGVSVDLGLLYYLYPVDKATGLDTDFFEPYASVTYTVGPVTTKVGANYAWGGQSGLGGNDSLYLRGDVSAAIPGTPLTALGHLGYTNGQLGILALTDDDYVDWSLGLEASHDFVKLGVQYVDTNIKDFGVGWSKAVGANKTVLGYLTVSF
ncbi:TorF family putative porin [Sphingomonas canadensis]|uniref:TorF family putative porin n=1 Tax=Sphingomonas canadensis TaxID=1219257 RepID=A0ABW3H131_9SPHN|nr:TorF family putative porin [Sphingomonas canadensis]MCW3835225.1 TorF family putative porin [Sphingomonas canadensis]